jgi:retinol dehydrogenase-13
MLLAGVLLIPLRMTSCGCEEQFTVNYLSHALLTQLLLDRLSQSGSKGKEARIVNITSVAYSLGRTDFENTTRE